MKYNLPQDVLDYLKSSEQEMLDLLEELCQIPAPSGKEELRVEYCKNWFERNGAPQVIVDEALNVVCPYNCEGKDDIVVFMAHTDVVFPDMTPLPLVKDGDIWRCPGISDDTACLVLMMMVAKYVFANKLQSDKGILFVANSCEEGLGNLKGTRQLLKDYAGRVTEFYTFDGGYAHVVNKCVGSHRYELNFASKGGHSFGAFGNTNAIAVMSNLITELYKCQVPVKENTKTTYNVGIVEGGTSVNTIAQSAKMLYEYRSDDKECLAIMKAFFEKTVEDIKATTDCVIDVTLVGDRPCGGDVDQAKLQQITNDIVEICQKHSGIPCVTSSGSTDANIPSSLGIPAVCVGSYKAWGAHKREEYVYISYLPIGYKITAETILRFFK